jgi:DsbC/DsbD-like thiol-disulfide interchange protein
MTRPWVTRRGAVGLGLGGLLALTGRETGRAQSTDGASIAASAWTGQKTGRVRLIAGAFSPSAGGPAKLYAGVHVRLADGWKTYWRQPGESGVPPALDWSGSANLTDARVLYPIPRRLPEAGMTSLGYKGDVVFPVEITPRESREPVELKLAFEYGVCKDICIPAEARLTLTVLPQLGAGEGALIGAHLARVPFPASPGSPSIASLKAEILGPAPRLTIDALFPLGSDGADALIEIPGGELAPLPVITGRTGRDAVRFEARFASAAEAGRFAGKPLLVTLFSANAQAEARAQVP